MTYSMNETSVTFTDDEWRVMLQDPVPFGFAAPCGHAVRADNAFYIAEGCPKCFGANEYGAEPPPADFPKVLCGHCKSRHIGVGAVRRCSQGG